MDSETELQSQHLIRVESEYTFSPNEEFSSFDEFMDRMNLLSKENFVHYWRRDSRTVENAFTKTARPLDKRIKYYYVRYACVFGGHKYRSRGQGIRPSRKVTRQTDCPAFISLKAAKCGTKLVVVDVCNDHNHEISQAAAELLPHNRRPSKELVDELSVLLEKKIDKKLIVEYAQIRESKKVTQKDLFNLGNRGIYLTEDERSSALQRIFDCICMSEDHLKSKILDKLGRSTSPNPPQNWNIKIECVLPPQNPDDLIIEDFNCTPDDCIIESSYEPCSIDAASIVVVNEFISNAEETVYPITYFQRDAFPTDLFTDSCASNAKGEEEIIFEDVITMHPSPIEELIGEPFFPQPSIEEVVPKEEVAEKCFKKSRKVIMNCRKCGSDARLIKMQLEYLRKKRQKLRLQIDVLKLKKKRLKDELK